MPRFQVDPRPSGAEHPEGGDRHAHGTVASGSGPMRSVDDVRRDVLQRVPTLAPIELSLPEAWGCVLAEDVAADVDLPPFSSSAMDGYAVRASDVADAGSDHPATLTVSGRAPIGRTPEATVGGKEAVEIATGSPIPAGADAVVPVESTVREGATIHVLRPSTEGAYIRPAGEEAKAGEVLVKSGRRLGPPELALVASAGRASVMVHPRPRVVVLSTGDELVEPGRSISYGQIRDANSFTLYVGLHDAGASPYLGGIVRDDADELKEAVLGFAARADCFITSGGVSVGERDVVKRAFFRRGEIDFYRVAMQPGMPQAFGFVEEKPYFGLPGNPVSVFVSFELFIRPAILKMMGRRDVFRPEINAELKDDITGPRDKIQFARVRVWRDQGRWCAASTGSSASNLLGTVARANGLAIIPVGTETAPAGSIAKVMLFRALEEQ